MTKYCTPVQNVPIHDSTTSAFQLNWRKAEFSSNLAFLWAAAFSRSDTLPLSPFILAVMFASWWLFYVTGSKKSIRQASCMKLKSSEAFRMLVTEQGLQLKDTVSAIALKAKHQQFIQPQKMSISSFQRRDREEQVYSNMKMSWGAFEGFSLLGHAHLFNEILSISTDIVHSVLVDSKISLKCLVLLQQALQIQDTGTSKNNFSPLIKK